MPKVPSENYHQIVSAFQRLGFVKVRQRGSHIRMEKRGGDHTIRVTIPAHRPVKRSTLAHLLKQAEVPLDDFLRVL